MYPNVQVAPEALLGQGMQLTTALNLVAKFMKDRSFTSIARMMLLPLLLI
jgi:hypothetical protein